MNQLPPKPPAPSHYKGAESENEKERLAKALRQNLQRRKGSATTPKPS